MAVLFVFSSGPSFQLLAMLINFYLNLTFVHNLKILQNSVINLKIIYTHTPTHIIYIRGLPYT